MASRSSAPAHVNPRTTIDLSKIAPNVIHTVGAAIEFIGRGRGAAILTDWPQRNLPNHQANAEAILKKGEAGLVFSEKAASSKVVTAATREAATDNAMRAK